MGAHNFETVVWTDQDHQVAYGEACSEATFEYGAEPYNGSISTTSGVQLHPTQRTPLPEGAADRLIGPRLDHLNKWENAEALPLAADDDVTYRTFTVAVTLTGSEYLDRDATQSAIELAAARKLKHGEHITAWATPDWKVATKIETAVTPGTAELRYYVERQGFGRLGVVKGIDPAGYPSKAAARAAAVAAVKAADQPLAVKVAARREVDGNTDLLTVTAVPTKATATVTVTAGRVAVSAATKGWLFYGWAAC